MKVFVYGSLKRNKKLHYYLRNARFLGEAVTCEKYPMILSKNGWYPYLLDEKGKGYKIKGELYEISHSLLKILDRLEETPFYYKRKKICVKLKSKALWAYAYFFAKKKKYLKKDLLKEF